MDMFSLKNLNNVDGKEQHHFEISKRFAALEYFDTELDTNRASKTERT
jgi:hypothetical protein